MSVLAIIPARSGSKRLPGKNLRPFCGKPLIVWSIEQALRIKEIDRIVVATDLSWPSPMPPIEGYSSAGERLAFWRRHSPILNGDDTPMARVIAWVLGGIQEWPSLVVLLHPTSPTRTDETVLECIRHVKDGPYVAAITSEDHAKPNGACYAFHPNQLPPILLAHSVYSNDIDINELSEFEKAEEIMKKRLA